jgi:hypothetical protein
MILSIVLKKNRAIILLANANLYKIYPNDPLL